MIARLAGVGERKYFNFQVMHSDVGDLPGSKNVTDLHSTYVLFLVLEYRINV